MVPKKKVLQSGERKYKTKRIENRGKNREIRRKKTGILSRGTQNYTQSRQVLTTK